MSIGEKLRSLRLRWDKTLKQQSEIFGVSLNTVYRWEHNISAPRKAMVIKIADYFDVPLVWLLNESAGDEIFVSGGGTRPETNTEQQLLRMYRRLSDSSKYKLIGYIERIYVEDMGAADENDGDDIAD